MSSLLNAADPARRQFRSEALQLAAVLLALKCVLLLVDPHLRIFLGDSGSYLHAAATDWIPPDRSFTYPWLVAVTAIATRSAVSLVMLQTLFGVLACLLLFWMLRRVAGLAPRWAAIPCLLLAIEPSQLFFERMMMAEAAGGLALLACVAAVAGYVHSGRLRWVPAFALAGIIAVSMRMSLLPVVLGLSLLAPFLKSWLHAGDEDRGQPLVAVLRLLLHVAAVLAVTTALHSGFKSLHAHVTEGPRDYMRAQGQMRIGLVAPLVQPEHLERVGLPVSLLDELTIPLRDHRTREAQIWMEGGLWQAILRHTETEEDAQYLAYKISMQALFADPVGLLRMGLANFRDYFDPQVTQHRMWDDLGLREPDAGIVEGFAGLIAHDVMAVHGKRSPVFVAFEHGQWWLTAVLFLLAPASLWLVIGLGRNNSLGLAAVALVIGFCGLGLVASQLLFSHIVSYRYLHPMPPLFLAVVALLVATSMHRITPSRSPLPSPEVRGTR